jgi:hypothetical protein
VRALYSFSILGQKFGPVEFKVCRYAQFALMVLQ